MGDTRKREKLTKRASYREGVAWIAYEDNLGDDEGVEELAGYISVLLLADLFGVSGEKVARDVYRKRHPGAV